MAVIHWERYPQVATLSSARIWLIIQADLGLAAATIKAYGHALEDYLSFCTEQRIEPEKAGRADIAAYVGNLSTRPHRRRQKIVHLTSGGGLSNATTQQRLVAVRLFYDYLVEEGQREINPVGRGRYTPGRGFAGTRAKGLVSKFTKLPWIPTEDQWQAILAAARQQSIRNRVMLALAYDAALRREELCGLCSDDLDPAHRTVRIRAETTKARRERVVPYSATTGLLLQAYLTHRRTLSVARGPLFLSESPRNRAEPITPWTWSKVVRRIALQAQVTPFSTHTLRHLCLTDLARSGWELHAIAAFAGHRNPATTLQYIHLSGRDLANKLTHGMAQIHSWRAQALTEAEFKGGKN